MPQYYLQHDDDVREMNRFTRRMCGDMTQSRLRSSLSYFEEITETGHEPYTLAPVTMRDYRLARRNLRALKGERRRRGQRKAWASLWGRLRELSQSKTP